MDRIKSNILIYIGIIIGFNSIWMCFGTKIIQTSAKSLGERAGAAQYAIHIEEALSSEEVSSKHTVKKRLSDETVYDDSDYEVYQGVVGRPGIDFPVLMGIPQTTFNCRKFGNGYFADLETDCQVFHICEGGKKISFLCPNGTIFQQTDLICDWWFKVNCKASPGHYAESSEILSKAQKRYRNKQPKNNNNEFNKNGSDSKSEQRNKHTDQRVNLNNSRRNGKTPGHGKPIQSNRRDNSGENYDFEDISVTLDVATKPTTTLPRSSNRNREPKHLSAINNSDESQETAESASFFDSKNRFKGYNYQSSKQQNQQSAETKFSRELFSQPKRQNILEQSPNRKAIISTKSIPISTVQPTTYSGRNLTSQQNNIHKPDQKPLLTSNLKKVPVPTHTRKTESTRTTPFYTPTVPSISKSISTGELLLDRNSIKEVTKAPRFSKSITSESVSPVSEHAIEMIKTLTELKLDNEGISQRLHESDSNTEQFVPTSSAETLHSLALYLAETSHAIMNNASNSASGKKPGGSDISAENITKYENKHLIEIESSLLSNGTIEKYAHLFGIEQNPTTVSTERSTISNLSVDFAARNDFNENDLDTQYSNNPILAAAETPKIRELAQVFTHALSAYLHDPSTFRRVLSEIRPTEPSVLNKTGNRSGKNYIDNETRPTYLPSLGTKSSENLEVLYFSDVTVSSPHNNSVTSQPKTVTVQGIMPNGEGLVTINVVANSDTVNNTNSRADHVPASNLLTHKLELDAKFNEKLFNNVSTDYEATESNNLLAMEVNGGLSVPTTIPLQQDDDIEFVQHRTNIEKSDYLPLHLNGIRECKGKSCKPHGRSREFKESDSNYDAFSFITTTNNPATTFDDNPLSIELLPPTRLFTETPKHLHSLEDDNDLQRAQSQSLIANNNALREQNKKEFLLRRPTNSLKEISATTPKNIYSIQTPLNGHYITKEMLTTEASFTSSKEQNIGRLNLNPWSTISYTVLLDPVTINDSLMETDSSKQNTYLPKYTKSLDEFTTTESSFTASYDSSATKAKRLNLPEKSQSNDDDYVQVLQRKANEMFGGLNDTSANHLLNVMRKADKNKTARKLILLLVQTCDEDYNKTVEQSRIALLNALIGMDDEKVDDIQITRVTKNVETNPTNTSLRKKSSDDLLNITSRRGFENNIIVPATTSPPPEIDFENNYQSSDVDSFESTTRPHSRDSPESTTTGETPFYIIPAELPSTLTTIVKTASTTPQSTSIRDLYSNTDTIATKSRRIAKGLDDLLAQPNENGYLNKNAEHKYSDGRALELLRSLYSLAGRFGK